jgi:hypothetical protein
MPLLSFHHLLNLSFAWHTQHDTCEVLEILDRGAEINNALRVRTSVPRSSPSAHLSLIARDIRCHSDICRYRSRAHHVCIWCVLEALRTFCPRTHTRSSQLRLAISYVSILADPCNWITRGIYTDCLLNYETVKYFSEWLQRLFSLISLTSYSTVSMNVLNLVRNLLMVSDL